MTEMFEGRTVGIHQGYAVIYIDRHRIYLHVLVWERIHGPKPDGHDVHHIDEDKGNFAIGNLVLLTWMDHRRVHAGWIKTEGIWSHKPCHKCKDMKEVSEYYADRTRGDGLQTRCKPCCKSDAYRQYNRRVAARIADAVMA